MLINLTDINKFYNGNQVLKNINLTIDESDKIGLVGVNGCGKSTLIKIITGKTDPDRFTERDGIVSMASKTTIGYLEQMGGLDSESTVLDEMKKVFSDIDNAIATMREIEIEMSKGNTSRNDEYHRLYSWVESNDGYNTDVKIKMILNGMGFTENELGRTVSGFSGGEKTRLAIAKLLLEEPNILILDEPTNHLDFKTIMWLEDYLKSYKGAVLVVSHDRFFLDRVCTSICEIERGVLTRYKGNYSAFVRLREEAVARQEKEYELQQKEIAKMEDYVAKNLVRASTSKSAKSRIKALDKMERIEKPVTYTKSAKIRFTYPVEPPTDVLSVKNIDISVGEGNGRKTLLDEISFSVRRGDKVGIIGDNGIGKSTLLKIIQEKIPHKGLVRWNSNIRISYFEQESTNLNKSLTVMEEIHHRYPTMSELDVRNILAQVRLTGENVFKETGVISGGERAKLCFAIMMLEHGNVLILDEPTNHLDLSSKDAIEQALEEYTGTVIFVSHDRYLLSKIATRIIELKSDGYEVYENNFTEYLDILRQRQDDEKRKADAEKLEKAQIAMREKSANAYKSKQQRSAEAERRKQIKALESEIDNLQSQLDSLNLEITQPEIFSDYETMNKKCSEIDRIRNLIDEKFDLLVELDI